MIFNRTYKFSSSKNIEQLNKSLLGQHVQVHKLDFEVVNSHDILKIIPHAENSDNVLTLPISHILFNKNNNNTEVRIKSHPRQIDIGGPYIVIIMAIFVIIAGIGLNIASPEMYGNAGKIMGIIGVVTFALLWIRMELGYFDYVRKINRWVKTFS
jgi:hypothetical protein